MLPAEHQVADAELLRDAGRSCSHGERFVGGQVLLFLAARRRQVVIGEPDAVPWPRVHGFDDSSNAVPGVSVDRHLCAELHALDLLSCRTAGSLPRFVAPGLLRLGGTLGGPDSAGLEAVAARPAEKKRELWRR